MNAEKYPGHFITFEGGEGSGKSTLVRSVAEQLKSEGYDVSVTREPGGVQTAEAIRDVIMEWNMNSPRTEALLYAAARQENLSENVIPDLKAGKIVLCDRYIDSSLVYRGIIGGIGVDEVYEMNRFATDNLMPECTIYLDLDPEIGLSRIATDSSREVNRIDLMDSDFHRQVRAGYQEIASSDIGRGRIRTVDAGRSREDVLEDTMEIINHALGRDRSSTKQRHPKFTGEMLEKEFRKDGWYIPNDMLLASEDGRNFCLLQYRPDCPDSYIINRYGIDADGTPTCTGRDRVHSLEGFEEEKAADRILSGNLETFGTRYRLVKYKIDSSGSDNTGSSFGGTIGFDCDEFESMVRSSPSPVSSDSPRSRLPGKLTGIMMKIYSENRMEMQKDPDTQERSHEKAEVTVSKDDGPEIEM